MSQNSRRSTSKKEKKNERIAEYEEIIRDAPIIVFTNYTNMDVPKKEALQRRMRDVGGGFKVVTRRLFMIALQNAGYSSGVAGVEEKKGQTAIAFSSDAVAAPRALIEFCKEHDIPVVLFGLLEGDIFDAAGVEALSKLPSREELIATVVARLLGQASQIGQRIAAPGQGLAGAIKAIEEQAAA